MGTFWSSVRSVSGLFGQNPIGGAARTSEDAPSCQGIRTPSAPLLSQIARSQSTSPGAVKGTQALVPSPAWSRGHRDSPLSRGARPSFRADSHGTSGKLGARPSFRADSHGTSGKLGARPSFRADAHGTSTFTRTSVRPRTSKSVLRTSLRTSLLALAVPLFCTFGFFGTSMAFGTGSVAWGGVAWWHVQSGSRPSFLVPGGSGQLVATVSNLGDGPAGGAVTISDELPGRLSAKSVVGEVLEGTGGEGVEPVVCSPHPLVERPLVCTVPGGLAAYDSVEVRVGVVVDPGAKVCKQNSVECEVNRVGVSSVGTASVVVSRPVTVSEEVEPFGVEAYEVVPEEEGGALTVQAGKHPFQVTGVLTMNQAATSLSVKDKLEGHPVALAKDLAGLLPPGLIGNPTPFAKCSITELDKGGCPPGSVVGVATATVNEPVSFGGLATFTTPIANMEPARGEPARFGFFAASVPVFLNAHVRSGGDYGVTLGSDDIPQTAAFLSYKLTFWGVPGVAAHDNSRTQECLLEEREKAPVGSCKPLGESSPPPLLAMPTACTGPLHTSTEADAWDDPLPEGQRLLVAETEPMPAMQGCNRLPFEAQVRVTPDGTAASTPTGLEG